jgi:kumamolisin
MPDLGDAPSVGTPASSVVNASTLNATSPKWAPGRIALSLIGALLIGLFVLGAYLDEHDGGQTRTTTPASHSSTTTSTTTNGATSSTTTTATTAQAVSRTTSKTAPSEGVLLAVLGTGVGLLLVGALYNRLASIKAGAFELSLTPEERAQVVAQVAESADPSASGPAMARATAAALEVAQAAKLATPAGALDETAVAKAAKAGLDTAGVPTAAERSAVPGSEREISPDHERVGSIDGERRATVTMYLRGRGSLDWIEQQDGASTADRRRMSHTEWEQAHGAEAADIEAVREFATAHGLVVQQESAARAMVQVTGTLAALTNAFGVQGIALYRTPNGTIYRGRSGEVTVPESLDGVVVAVLGIDDRPQASPHMRVRKEAINTAYTPVEVAKAYEFPAGVDGTGETVGIIELEGGYDTAELAQYFQELKLGMPKLVEIGVDGGSNSPGGAADGEVMLDIEVVGAVAPGAGIAVYFAPDASAASFVNAVSQAVHDSATSPSVISISWGGPEESWTAQARTQMERVLTEATALGITVTVAAGDSGSSDGVAGEGQHVDFPAAAPHALACGGTTLALHQGTITKEEAWNDGPGKGATGGGVSVEFPLPAYQTRANVPPNLDTKGTGRGVPDVAGDADPATGYKVLFHGETHSVGGTSAVAPLWAGLVARFNQAIGKPVGFMQPALYQTPAAFNDVRTGDNGAYSAGQGWDACTGLGSPKGTALLAALK